MERSEPARSVMTYRSRKGEVEKISGLRYAGPAWTRMGDGGGGPA